MKRLTSLMLFGALLVLASVSCESDDATQADTGSAADSDAPADTTETSSDTVTADTAADTVSVPDAQTDTSSGDTQADTSTPADTQADTTVSGDTVADTTSPQCQGNDDCTWCAYPTAPASVDDCYCAGCPSDVTDAATCEANASAWASACAGWASSCPDPRCVQTPQAICTGDRCFSECDLVDCAQLDCPVDQQFIVPGECCPQCPVDPAICADGDDCTRCAYDTPVESVEDCYCTLCPYFATTTAQCGTWRQQWQDTCSGTWSEENPCPVAICLPPEPTTCVDGTCGGCDQITCEVPDCAEHLRFTAEGECCQQCPPEPTPCTGDSECGFCPYKRGVNSPSECYCTLCDAYGVTEAQCTEWGDQWNTHCSGFWAATTPCPVAICLPAPPAVCDDAGACVQDPYSCNGPDDCGTCTHAVAPTSPSECECPGCPVAMSITECNDITTAVTTHCSGGELDDCLPLPCAQPPPTSCDLPSRACVFQPAE